MKYKKLFFILIAIILICILSVCCYKIITMFKEKDINDEQINEIIEQTIVENNENHTKEIDWKYLKQTNEDIVGWIEIEDTNINYPILRDENLYYMNHNFNRSYNSNGSIFTTNTNIAEDEEILIYGHNMKNGSMFSNLGKYLDYSYLKEHQKIKIYTPDKNYEAIIFSAYSTNVFQEQKIIKNMNLKEIIEHYINSSAVKLDNINVSNKIVKLSTCSYINAKTRPTEERYYIVASIVNE